jgi:hypothetical protein
MIRSHTLSKIIALTAVGFAIPVAVLLPVEYALSEYGTQPDWNTLVDRYLPPATGCSLFFLASAITSSTPRKLVTFVQSLFLHGTTFIVCALTFVPIQHHKVGDPQQQNLSWIPFVSVFLLFMALLIIGNIRTSAKIEAPNPNADGTHLQ